MTQYYHFLTVKRVNTQYSRPVSCVHRCGRNTHCSAKNHNLGTTSRINLQKPKIKFPKSLGHFLHTRIPPVENGPFRLDSSGPSSYRQSNRFHSVCALPRGGWCEGVLLYGSRQSVGSSVLRAFFASNACFTRDEPSSKRVVGDGLSRKPLKLRLGRCAQPRAAKATPGVAVVGKMASITRATAVV